jgi:Alpha/beta hydrolase domain containing 18
MCSVRAIHIHCSPQLWHAQICISGMSMGGIHACMVAAHSTVPVACVAMLPPRSAAVAYCDGKLSSFVDARKLYSSKACDSEGVPIVVALAAAYQRSAPLPNTPSPFAHNEAATSYKAGEWQEDTLDEQQAREQAARSADRKSTPGPPWLPPVSTSESAAQLQQVVVLICQYHAILLTRPIVIAPAAMWLDGPRVHAVHRA